MDGCGLAPADGENAVAAAKTPFLDSLYEKYPHTTLGASGEDVGLPDGQMGNSEVGHLNIGAGRIVFQELSRINNAIKDGSIAKNEVFVKAMDDVKADGKTLKASVDYTVTGDVAIKPGLHKAVIKGKGNYSFTSSVYYRVKYSVPSYAKTTDAKTTYSGKAQAAKITVKNGSKTLKAGRAYVVSGTTKAKNAGKNRIKITG